jgi:nucleoid DNA-binding protein
MNKLQLTEQLAVRLGVTHSEAVRFLNGLTNMIYGLLQAGDEVNISGFGKFRVSHRASRSGINPKNPSQKITIPELNVPKFKAGEAFKEAIKLKK